MSFRSRVARTTIPLESLIGLPEETGGDGFASTTRPMGPAGGDLNETYPDPRVVGWKGKPLGSSMGVPAAGEMPRFNGSTWESELVPTPIAPVACVYLSNPSGVDTQPGGLVTTDGITPVDGTRVLLAAGDDFDGVWLAFAGDWVPVPNETYLAGLTYPVTVLLGDTQAMTEWYYTETGDWLGTGKRWMRFPADAAISIRSTAGLVPPPALGLGGLWTLPINGGAQTQDFGTTGTGVGLDTANTKLLYTANTNDLRARLKGIYRIEAMAGVNIPAAFAGQILLGVYVNAALTRTLTAPYVTMPAGAAGDYAFSGSTEIVITATDVVTISLSPLIAGPTTFGACATTNSFEVSASLVRRL